MLSNALLSLALLQSVRGAPPVPWDSVHPFTSPALHKRCGAVSQYYDQQLADWNTYHTTEWLDDWWNRHGDLVSGNSAGFAGAFGQWALGNPDWSCRDDGSESSCDLSLCDNRVLNDLGDDMRPAYYVLESINRLHTYFTGISEAFTTAALDAALSKDSWATTFYRDKDVKSATILKEVLVGVATIVGIGAAFAGLGAGAVGATAGASSALGPGALGATAGASSALGPGALGAIAGASSALMGGGVSATAVGVQSQSDDTFQKSADLGGVLGEIVVSSLKTFTAANNQLMSGQSYNDVDIRTYLSGGAFLAFGGVDKNAVSDAMTNMLIGTAINQLYRTQKIFIMGGGACGDNQGIGSGPEQASICRDGKAWYLYYWQENDVISTTSHQWGWVASPPGADQLGQGAYSGVSVQDIIESSLDAYNVAGYNYDADTRAARAEDAIANAWASPGSKGAAWEGIFTVPVCDVGSAVDADYEYKQYILQPYGHDSRPIWCGPVCKGDLQTTKDFIHAANMDGFKSPKQMCLPSPGY